MERELTEAGEIYKQLWAKAGPLLESGEPRIDPFLRNKAGDERRGVTLVGRPDAVVQENVEAFLRQAAEICPRQHFYRTAELHMTVMAVIAGSESWRVEMEQLPACRAVLDEVLKGARTFRVDFRGVTVSPDAVIIQGFAADSGLTALRGRLRDAFEKAGLGKTLDRRYKTVTAHLTAMRFADPAGDWKRLFDFLQANRERDFGLTQFQKLELIQGDWYASADVVRVLQEYPLAD